MSYGIQRNQGYNENYILQGYQGRPAEQYPMLIVSDAGSLQRLYEITKSSNITLTEETQAQWVRCGDNLLIQELKEILQDKDSWKEDGILISESSINYAIQFVENSIIRNGLDMPDIEIHPDGQASFTWRKSKIGIINFAFDENGLVTWAAYFENPKRTLKGRFLVKDSMSDEEKSIITKISAPRHDS